MTKEEIAKLIDKMPQGMDADDYIYELVNRALAVERALVQPVDAVNMSQDRVDETAKREHEPWQSVQCTCGGTIYFKHTKREWVGLDGEIPGLGLVTEEFYNGMLFAEDILREKNGG